MSALGKAAAACAVAAAGASIGECGAASMEFALAGEAPARFERARFEVSETIFPSGGTRLAGRLVLPAARGRVPVAVLVHGSERFSRRAFYHEQHMLPAHGIGVWRPSRGIAGPSRWRLSRRPTMGSSSSGKRTGSVSRPEGYFALVMDWIREGALEPASGKAVLRPAPKEAMR